MDFNFYMPTKIYFGNDIILKNKNIFNSIGHKALIVTGRSSAKKNGYLDFQKFKNKSL